ncbi:XRE family transcriptional regulator [Xenorhabdus bovienii]|uniref:Putative transcriptional regulator n=1 Tax=Xenorhabdus bovienii str. Intermedium TaxID=1379677 RepID=A0A077QN66_XENBV|nr:XRE family transcriptional regulator [Xenorhabdus bovienii]MDE9482472.1 XRE family transcriptional regulator [Xenorhabdus bovienii]MDE9493456.1 XRE family transcriptional regulator [Xenorhabdus bovienii]MDE9501992.1 XRE family transcriptional regulator [Xenorhabdus bovienii]MDE9525777.1 XRE family transcriptional regulator [Xenorhabdus bovienii]MDE9544531.1 XRE family transcriptional regulator [Xenorhabdus bovienii]
MNNTQQQDRVKKNCIDIGNKVKRLRLARNISLNELSKLSGVSKAALSQLESGNSNPRIDTLDAIAIALRLPLGDLFGSNNERYPYLEKNIPMEDTYSQVMKFRIGLGSVAEIWHLQMNPGVIISSPAHTVGTHEHIMIHDGVLMLRLSSDESVILNPGDFYAFSGDVIHSYICIDVAVSATVVMSYSIQS